MSENLKVRKVKTAQVGVDKATQRCILRLGFAQGITEEFLIPNDILPELVLELQKMQVQVIKTH